MPSPSEPMQGDDRYVVVARRYRPQSFEQLVGQGQVAHALSNAILSNRVGHAYLFTGARGVGKTSTARIFAKALNCQQGPTPTPCNTCDICQSIAAGGDVDVLEIDGASNRGIDEIRQLRSNVGMRPSRGRFKVYIIDEVHMLTKEAFNALLKTLEEPPPHVKFVFCTTDPEKIPITVLSRCQRFDFPPVETGEILTRLREIARSEGVEAEEDALRLLARRANGSMRDSQSLLEQLLSFCGERITTADVHAMLGTAGVERLHGLLEALRQENVGDALKEVDLAIAAGVDASQLTEQLAGIYRDMLAASSGCSVELLLHSSPDDYEMLAGAGKELGVAALLGALQILDETLVRMRQSPLARTLLEVAVVRLCKIGELQDVADLIQSLNEGRPPGQKKNERRRDAAAAKSATPANRSLTADRPTADRVETRPHQRPPQAGPHREPRPPHAPMADAAQALEVADAAPQRRTAAATASEGTVSDVSRANPALERPVNASHSSSPAESDEPLSGPLAADAEEPSSSPTGAGGEGGVLDASNAETIWREALETMDEDSLLVESAREYDSIAISAPNQLAVRFQESYNWHKQRCERPESKHKLEQALQRVVGRPIRVEFETCGGPAQTPPSRKAAPSRRQLARDAERHPLVSEAVELFGAEVTRVSRYRDAE